MNFSGAYSEEIGKGGKLVVTRHSWHLEYYWAGPDLRYNGTFKRVPGADIDDYINAWKANFEKYLELRAAIPKGGEFVQPGAMGMQIRVHTSLGRGVCLQSYHCSVRTEQYLKEMVNSYLDAKHKASVIQRMLAEVAT